MKKIILLFVCISIFFLFRCTEEGESYKLHKGSWELGREQFINNCAYCHVPINKDEEFIVYIENKSLQGLQVILKDSFHILVNKETMDTLDLKAIEAFILHKPLLKYVE